MNAWEQFVIGELPGWIAELKRRFAKKNPDIPPPTSEEVIAAMEQTFSDSLAKDQVLKAALQAEIDAGGGTDA